MFRAPNARLTVQRKHPAADKLFILQEFAILSCTNSQVPGAPPKDIKYNNMHSFFCINSKG